MVEYVVLQAFLWSTRTSQQPAEVLVTSKKADGCALPTQHRLTTASQEVEAEVTSFTEPALWERCASDFQQCLSGHFSGRVHFATLLNLDESCRVLKYMGLAATGKGFALRRGTRRSTHPFFVEVHALCFELEDALEKENRIAR